MNDIEIFTLCERLAELLSNKEAFANLKTLQERHPEMFEKKEQVAELINVWSQRSS